jgi:very-short-patch-repair endonuclease
VISREQLLELGFTGDAVRHRIATGRLHPLWRGVYAVGRPNVSRHGMWTAALLAAGPNAVLSHSSAAAFWEIASERSGAIEVSITGWARRHPGIVAHRRSSLRPDDVMRRRGIRITTPICTIIDIAPRLDRDGLEQAIGEADKRDLTNPVKLRAALDEIDPRPGVAIVRKTLDRRSFVMTHTQLERYFVPIVRRAGLPPPEGQRRLGRSRVDFYWWDIGLVVETDGLRYHRTAMQQTKDTLRTHQHAVAGLTPLRFTHEQIRYDRGYVERTLAAVAHLCRSSRSRCAAPHCS